MSFVSIDFETANKYRDSACAIGIVIINEQGVREEFYSLINPLMEFDFHNVYVHGITESDVIDAPTFEELWPTIKGYLNNHLLVAHNASFDMSVLRACLDRYRLDYPKLEYLCSVMISKQVWPGLPNYKLNTLAELHGIQFAHHHALDDARVVIELLLRANKETEVTSVRELIDVIQISCGKIFERSYITPKAKRNKRTVRSRGVKNYHL
ncbi:3'-5' exonuclease [Radiobacillus sp. PE A8.2]|uniref:3'-5' exonuclease n=1 Tax=Radiobacillus sp. PE A8.2 TaxID=3380349 RepID=UPI0038903BE3